MNRQACIKASLGYLQKSPEPGAGALFPKLREGQAVAHMLQAVGHAWSNLASAPTPPHPHPRHPSFKYSPCSSQMPEHRTCPGEIRALPYQFLLILPSLPPLPTQAIFLGPPGSPHSLQSSYPHGEPATPQPREGSQQRQPGRGHDSASP